MCFFNQKSIFYCIIVLEPLAQLLVFALALFFVAEFEFLYVKSFYPAQYSPFVMQYHFLVVDFLLLVLALFRQELVAILSQNQSQNRHFVVFYLLLAFCLLIFLLFLVSLVFLALSFLVLILQVYRHQKEKTISYWK